jgi:hypothetical protein
MVAAGADLGVGAGLVGRLAGVTVAPAIDRAGRGQAAGVGAAGADLGVGAGLVGRLAGVILAPTVDGAGRGQAAAIAAGGADLGEGAGLVGRLAIGVVAPAVDGAGRGQRRRCGSWAAAYLDIGASLSDGRIQTANDRAGRSQGAS